MTKDQKSKLNELLEALEQAHKKSTSNSIEISYDGTVAGVEDVVYRKGDDYICYNRNFEWYSHTRKVDADDTKNEVLIDIINYSINNDDYNSFVETLCGHNSEFLYADSYDYNNYDLYLTSMDYDEIPEEISDGDEGIDVLKLEDNGWSLVRGEAEDEIDESEMRAIYISVDDKQFTFKSV